MNLRSRWLPRAVLVLLPVLFYLGSAGCKVVEETVKLPAKTVTAVIPGNRESQEDPAALQTQLLRYADDFSSRTMVGLDEYARRVTERDRTEVLTWRVTLATTALGIATGANPTANLVDFLAFSSLIREFLERTAKSVEPPGALDVWLENSRLLETNAWRIAETTLTDDQREEIRSAIQRWLAETKTEAAGFFRRPQELLLDLRESAGSKNQAGVFAMVGLDPTLGLDPAIREVTRSRLFAERALYATQRLPFLLRWQAELLNSQITQTPQMTNALASAERLSRAADSFSRTADSLPDRVTAERKAILEALEAQEGKLRALSAEVSQTLAAGEKMSISLNTTLVTFDALMQRFGVGVPDTTPRDTNSPPFNILDYARTAEQIALMAQQLDALIKDASGTLDTPALDKRIEQLNALSARARKDARSVLNHGALLAAGLIVFFFVCAFVYRRTGARTPAAQSAVKQNLTPSREAKDI